MRVFLIFVLGFIAAAKSQSAEEILSGCTSSSTKTYLYCYNFQHSHLPFNEEHKYVREILISGNFTNISIDPNYVNLLSLRIQSTNLQNLQLQDYTNFTKIEQILVDGSEQELNLNFTGADKIPSLKNMFVSDNKMLSHSCEDSTSSNLTSSAADGVSSLHFQRNNIEKIDCSCFPLTVKNLYFNYNNFAASHHLKSLRYLSNLNFLSFSGNSLNNNRFNFGYLPLNIKYLYFYRNEISELGGCEGLRNLSNLSQLYLYGNNLTSFDLSCIPPNLLSLDLYDNNIASLDLSQLSTDRISLRIHDNPIQCTCSFMRDYVQLLDSGNVTFLTNGLGGTVNCANTASKLADYPWTNNATALKLFDVSVLDCLAGGEDDVDENLNIFHRILYHLSSLFSRFF